MARSTLVALFALLMPTLAQAQCVGSGHCILPPGGCAYVGVGTIDYGGSEKLNAVIVEQSNACHPFPPLGASTLAMFDAVVDINLSSDGGSSYTTVAAPASLTAHVTTTNQIRNNKTIQTELLQMDVSGGSLPAGVLLRESPTLASSGQAQSTDLGGGQFQISSFFDVFTELSLDSGQTWHPASGSVHIDLLQGTPLATRVATWGSVKATYH